jgi:hypothetical protein
MMKLALWKAASAALVAAATLALPSAAQAQPFTASVATGRNGSGPFDLFGNVTYSYAGSPRQVSWRTQAPVLCADFGTPINTMRLQTRDPNGDVSVDGNLSGISGISYDYVGRRLSLEASSTTNVLRCRLGALASGAGTDLIFGNGFEVSPIDLAVTISAQTAAITPSTLNYTITVRNLGTANADSVKVRDFFTKRASTSSTDPGLSDGTWTCAASGSASCGTPASGTGRINTAGASIPAGGGNLLTYTIARGVLANTTLNTNVTLAAAAFHAPTASSDDTITTNDAQQRRVLITNNRPPVISFAQSSYTVGVEDQTAPLSPVTFTVTDPDGDPVATFAAATIGNTQVFESGAVSGSQPQFTLQLTSAGANANGTSNVTVRATDGQATSDATISATVTAVNDPPTAVLSGVNCRGANNIVTTAGNPFLIALPTSASARSVTCDAFLTTTPGPANEAGQVVTVATPTLTGDGIFSLKPAPSYTAIGGGVYTFNFLLNPAPADASACVSSSATDDGSNTPPNENSKLFRVRINIGTGNGGVSCSPAP